MCCLPDLSLLAPTRSLLRPLSAPPLVTRPACSTPFGTLAVKPPLEPFTQTGYDGGGAVPRCGGGRVWAAAARAVSHHPSIHPSIHFSVDSSSGLETG